MMEYTNKKPAGVLPPDGPPPKKVSHMNNTAKSVAPAIVPPQDSLRILSDVAHIYELAKAARRDLAKAAQQDGHTYQALGDAMGTDRSSAHTLINGRAA